MKEGARARGALIVKRQHVLWMSTFSILFFNISAAVMKSPAAPRLWLVFETLDDEVNRGELNLRLIFKLEAHVIF